MDCAPRVESVQGVQIRCNSGDEMSALPELGTAGQGGSKVVFRRDNKVDAFQRQMSSLRQQIGGAPGAQEDEDASIPDLEDERFPREAYNAPQAGRDQDTGGYSFGSYPSGGDQPMQESASLPMPEVPQIPASDGLVSVIAKATLWKGDLESEGSLHVYGRVEGQLRAKEDIWIAEGADVNATIQARRVIVGGNVSGSIRSIDRFEALPQCQISADIQAPVFVVHEGANINGQLKMGTSEGPGDSRTERAGSPAIIQRRARTGA
jgi:cytoskeletal protein CcmA (bactofilin family)